MAKKKTAAKARPAGRKKPAAKAGKKAVRGASPKKKKAVAKKAKSSPRKATSAKKQVAKKGAKVKVVPKSKIKPAKVARKVIKPVAKKAVVTKAQPKPIAASKIAVKPPSKNGAPTKLAPVAKATPMKPAKAAPVVTKPAPKAAPVKEVATVTAPRPTPRPAPAPPMPVVLKKALKEKVTIEFMVNSSPAVLYEMISSPSGFAEWYCTDVNVRGDQYTFIWPDEQESTTLIGRKLGEVIRFHRNDDDDEGSYFEFRVRIDAMTNEVALIVTDHAWPAEVEETRNLWNSQIHSLLRVLGA